MAFENDWEFLRAAVPDLQRYVLSADLYSPLRLTAPTPGSIRTPQLTIGNVALSLLRLSALPLSAQQKAQLSDMAGQINAVKEAWRANWAKKATQEYTSRLNLWQQYLSELRGDPQQQSARYANEVRQRAILDLLSDEMLDGIPPHEVEQVTMLDTILRGLTKTGPFVWEPEVAASFPQDRFWYLHVSLGK